jgi:hypothetical protein
MTKNLLVIALMGLGAISSLGAGARMDGKTFRSIQTYDLRGLRENLKSHTREFVAVKFNFRGKDIHHLKPNWYESSIWQRDPEGKKPVDLRVMVAKKGLPAFKSITTDASSAADITVYGRVLWDADSKFTFIQLIGRNAMLDGSGNAIVSW